MKIYLISNNLVLENIIYQTDESLEQKRINRPLAVKGEKLACKLASNLDVQAIYSSDYASALATAKYVALEKNLPIYIDSNLRDTKIGELGKNKTIGILRVKQELDFDYSFVNGESINETKLRMQKIMTEIIQDNKGCNIAVFTHKRAILSYLIDYTDVGFNLDNRLILSYDDKVIIDDADKDIDIIEITILDGKIVSMLSV